MREGVTVVVCVCLSALIYFYMDLQHSGMVHMCCLDMRGVRQKRVG